MLLKWKRILFVVSGLLAIVISIVWLSGGFEKKINIMLSMKFINKRSYKILLYIFFLKY